MHCNKISYSGLCTKDKELPVDYALKKELLCLLTLGKLSIYLQEEKAYIYSRCNASRAFYKTNYKWLDNILDSSVELSSPHSRRFGGDSPTVACIAPCSTGIWCARVLYSRTFCGTQFLSSAIVPATVVAVATAL